MSFVITDQTALRAIHQAYVEKDWPEAYQLVFNEITDIGFVSGINSPKADVEAGAWLWIKGARIAVWARRVATILRLLRIPMKNRDYVF